MAGRPKRRAKLEAAARAKIFDPFSGEGAEPEPSTAERLFDKQLAPRAGVTRETCPGCHFQRPQSEFFEGPPQPNGEWLCLRCRVDGKPQPDPVDLSPVPPQHRIFLQEIFKGQKLRDAARAAGMNLHTANNVLRNLNDKPQSIEFQRLFRALLLQEGLDAFAITRQIRFSLQSTEARWNTALSQWDHFPDNKSRLRAAEILAKLHALMPKEDRQQAAVKVEIYTNLDSPQEEAQSSNFEIEVEGQVVE